MKPLSKTGRHILTGLPLAAVLIASFFRLSRTAEQGLVAFTLVWFQVFILDILRGQ
jgi:hypothetical protein